MVDDKCVLMIQESRYRWKLVAPKGHTMLDNLYFSNAFKAEDWVKAYISTWPTWSYEVVINERKSM